VPCGSSFIRERIAPSGLRGFTQNANANGASKPKSPTFPASRKAPPARFAAFPRRPGTNIGWPSRAVSPGASSRVHAASRPRAGGGGPRGERGGAGAPGRERGGAGRLPPSLGGGVEFGLPPPPPPLGGRECRVEFGQPPLLLRRGRLDEGRGVPELQCPSLL